MDKGELRNLFKKYDDEFLVFDQVANKFSDRADLHAFILLDKICPGDADIVSNTMHDEIHLAVSPDELAEKATEDQVLELIRSGLRYSSKYGVLAMYV